VKYTYKAIDVTGKEVNDKLEASSYDEAVQKVRELGLFVMQVLPVVAESESWSDFQFEKMAGGWPQAFVLPPIQPIQPVLPTLQRSPPPQTPLQPPPLQPMAWSVPPSIDEYQKKLEKLREKALESQSLLLKVKARLKILYVLVAIAFINVVFLRNNIFVSLPISAFVILYSIWNYKSLNSIKRKIAEIKHD